MSIMKRNKVTILGLGKSGYAAARYLAKHGTQVILLNTDKLKARILL